LADTNATPVGNVSETTTPVASDGPPLCTDNVYVNESPAVTVAGADFVIDKSADGAACTVVDADALLFAAFGSAGLPETLAVFVTAPVADGAVTTIETEAFAPLASAPTGQVTVPELFTQPLLADTNATPAGNVSETATPVASLGPALWTESVYVNESPAVPVAGADFVIHKSADGAACTVVEAEALLLPVLGSVGPPDTDAVFVTVPVALGAVTVIIDVALAPVASAPTVHVTVPALFTHPALADTNATPVGNVSETTTPVEPHSVP